MHLLGRLLNVKDPLLGIGALLLVLAFVKTSGSSFSPTAHPSYPLGVVGAGLLALGAFLELDERRIRARDRTQRFSEPVLYDAPFWHKVFDAMPPAFVKAVSADEPHAIDHIAENASLERFQGSSRPGTDTDEERNLIRADHRRGDEEALSGGKSLFIESSDTYGISPTRQIVTIKTSVKYGGQRFVVGWFVPVELPQTLGKSETYCAKETGQQVTFGLLNAPDSEGIRLTIGEAAQRAAEARQSRSPQT